jgi:hypothetical protein
MEAIARILAFLGGISLVTATVFSALSTFVLPRAARSRLNRLIFRSTRRVFGFIIRFLNTYEKRDAVMAYYAPVSLFLMVPVWYFLIMVGYAAMYWSAGVGDAAAGIRLSGSSLLTLGFASSDRLEINLLIFSEALLGLILVALLIAYLPTMYAAFARREQAVNMLEVRAGNPPNPYDMLTRFQRIHGLDKLADYWKVWEIWFADLEESHTTLPAIVFFRSSRPDQSWITAAGAILDTASLTLSSIEIPNEMSAALCIRAGYIALRRIADYFGIPYPANPAFETTPISVTREEYDSLIDALSKAGVPVKEDREQAWRDYAGWRVNYDHVLLMLCSLVMAPAAAWSSDRAPRFRPAGLFKHTGRTA